MKRVTQAGICTLSAESSEYQRNEAMKNWNHLPSGEIELTIESEAYLELAKDDLLIHQYDDARHELEVAVRSANPQAEYLLGALYEHALGVDRDKEKALLWYLRAAEYGYAPAQTAAAALYIDGDDGLANYGEAYRLLTLAAQKGYRSAVFMLAKTIAYGIECNEVWAKMALEYDAYDPLMSVALRYMEGNAAPQDSKKGLSILKELADKGIGSAQITLAKYLIKGKSMPKDADQAFRYLSLAAETGHDDALVELGNFYFDGAGDRAPDQEEAFGYYRQAAEKDVPRGWELVGYCLYEGKGAPQNRQEALGWYEKAAEQGLYNSYYMMGMIYGYDEALFNYEKAVSCFEKSARLGQTDALVRLGTMHLRGVGVITPDHKKAFSYFIQATQADNSHGWEWAAYCHYWGYGTSQNRQKALAFYQKAAQKGLSHSQYMLGYIYGYDVTPPDFKKAARWFEKAARQGHSDAQLKLGFYYHNGCGVLQDYKEAFKLFTQAAAQDHATAMHNLGDAYENGFGVEKDEKKAFAWYCRSAELGDKWGMFGAGRLLFYGIGTSQNQEAGQRWINKAAKAGLQDAIDWRPQ